MKRRNYTAEITENGNIIATKTTHAWNSGIRTTEELMRAYARGVNAYAHGDKPAVANPNTPEAQYLRTWTCNGHTIVASVWEQI